MEHFVIVKGFYFYPSYSELSWAVDATSIFFGCSMKVLYKCCARPCFFFIPYSSISFPSDLATFNNQLLKRQMFLSTPHAINQIIHLRKMCCVRQIVEGHSPILTKN